MTSDDDLAALHDGRTSPEDGIPVDEPDLGSWAWHRATGAAVAVLVAAAAGLVVAPPASAGDLAGPVMTGGTAGAVVYTVGPLLALLERRRLRDGPVTPARLRRYWLLATLVLAGLPSVTPSGIAITVVGGPIALAAAWIGTGAGLRLPAPVGRPLALLVPALVVTAGVVAAAEPTVVDVALILALLVVVPAAVALQPGHPDVAPLVVLAAGSPAAASLLLSPGDGNLAGALVLPWVLLTAGGAARALARWSAGGWRSRDGVTFAACGYLAFGSLWLLADRVAYGPAGFGPPFVQLTAVHFTYAGFVATVLAARAWARHPDHRAATTAVGAMVAAPPFVAVGFGAVGALQIVGALLLTVGTYALAWVTLRRVVPSVRPSAAGLLAVSSVSVLVPMLLAVQWAVGTNLGTPALSVPAMAATHGVANAVGFALCGVLGWLRVPREERGTGDGGQR